MRVQFIAVHLPLDNYYFSTNWPNLRHFKRKDKDKERFYYTSYFSPSSYFQLFLTLVFYFRAV